METCYICKKDDSLASLVEPCCNCSMKLHQNCLQLTINGKIQQRDVYNSYRPENWLIWLFEHDKYQPRPKFLQGNPKSCKKIIIQDKKSFRFGFVDYSLINNTPNILDNLIISYMKPNDSSYFECFNCSNIIRFYGYKSKMSTISKFVDKLKCISLILTSLTTITFLSLTSIFYLSFFLIITFSWEDEFYRESNETAINFLMRILFIPHYIYSITSPNIGLLNLILSCIYSHLQYGIPKSIITYKFQNFIYFKLFYTIIYRLTINRYYFKSFKETIPALFGFQLSCEDAWAIQTFKNENLSNDDNNYEKLTIWDKIKLWFKESIYCLNKDFGELYRISNLDFIFGKIGFISITLLGLIIGKFNFTKGLFYNMFFTDLQNEAISKLIGISIVEITYILISTYNSISLAECYKNLKPQEGLIPIKDIKNIVKYLYESLMFNPADLFY